MNEFKLVELGSVDDPQTYKRFIFTGQSDEPQLTFTHTTLPPIVVAPDRPPDELQVRTFGDYLRDHLRWKMETPLTHLIDCRQEPSP